MVIPCLAVPGLTLPAAMAGSHALWLGGTVILLTLLSGTARLLNWLAARFERCPRCQKVVRAEQRVCHHCLEAVKTAPAARRS